MQINCAYETQYILSYTLNYVFTAEEFVSYNICAN